jgi:molecular chaperone DnaK
MGAAIQAAIVAGQNVGAVLVDITPHSMGIKSLEIPSSHAIHLNEFKFAPIINRNTPLPASRSEMFCTVADNQPTVEIDVFQGESGDVRRNHRVGRFLVEGLARVPAGNQLVVQMDLTLDGTLKVSAREKATGMVKQITIENAMARFAVEERDAAQQRLERMWSNPSWDEEEENEDPMTVGDIIGGGDDEADEYFEDEEDDTPWAETDGTGEPEPSEQVPVPSSRISAPAMAEGTRESTQARSLLEKADRVRGKASAEDQAELDKLTGRVKSALEEKRWADVQSACTELADVLFYLEDA